MKSKFSKISLAFVLSLSLLISACGNTSTNKEEVQQATTPQKETAAPNEEKIDPLGKYDTPIELTAVRVIDEATPFLDGEDISNNNWTKLYESLGMKINYLWTVAGTWDQYLQKLNISIASGDLPDIMVVNTTILKQLADAGQLADMTDTYNKYASPLTKGFIAQSPNALESATFKGKVLGFPSTGGLVDSLQVLWIRTDWLKKLNLAEPKTMDDVLNIAQAFAKNDPDGNGKADTFGLPLTKDLWGPLAGLEGFFNSYHAYPNQQWIKDASGNLVYGGIQPEMKTALGKLQKLFKDGVIDKEFGVKDMGKLAEDITAGKVGMNFGVWWNPAWPQQQNHDNDPKAEWKAFSIPSSDGKLVSVQTPFNADRYYVASKKNKHPEALIKMANLFAEVNRGEMATKENALKYGNSEDGKIPFFKYSFINFEGAQKNLDVYNAVQDAFKTKDPSKLNVEEKVNYDNILAYRNEGKQNFWNLEGMYGSFAAWPVIQTYMDNKQMQPTAFFGAPTKSMGEKMATLNKLELEAFTKIIMNGVPIDEFDSFVASWNKLGGAEITKEVNEWNASRK